MASILLRPTYMTLHWQDTILIMGSDGWITGRRAGLFSQDTRYVSSYRLTLNGFEPVFLGASQSHYFATTLYYTNPRLGSLQRAIQENGLLIKINRLIQDGMHEDIELTNYTGKRVQLLLTINLGSDFADIFQVRGLERIIPRLANARWDAGKARLSLHYRKGDFRRTFVYQYHRFSGAGPTQSIGGIGFQLDLAPGQQWSSCADLSFEDRTGPGHPRGHTLPDIEKGLLAWQASTTGVETPGSGVEIIYRRAISDVAGLRLLKVEDGWFPAAGIPWYVAVFSRDALVLGLQFLLCRSQLAHSVLSRLVSLQGRRINTWTEEEPGKLPHELRQGELAVTGKIPHSPYYGTVDAPLLFVVLLHELYRFTGDQRLVEEFFEPARQCLKWAEQYGDIDGDDFVEYRPQSPQGYRNQGWKDAFDAVVYPDGTLVEPPIAICEVQGYYFDALRRMAAMCQMLGHDREAATYLSQAEAVHHRIEGALWLEDEGLYAMGLDSKKHPIRSVASNCGHLMWSGAVMPERAERMARRLMADDMFSGWGIRTLSSAHRGYDPVSYQLGSVWPHDNGLIALGMKRYGLWQQANRIAEGIFSAASHYENSSLPELFAGMPRQAGGLPVPYANSNMPQAWAAGSAFMLLQAILGLEPDPERRALILAPTLPEWLPELTLRGLSVLGSKVDLRFRGTGLETAVEVLSRQGDLRIEVRRADMPENQAGALRYTI